MGNKGNYSGFINEERMQLSFLQIYFLFQIDVLITISSAKR